MNTIDEALTVVAGELAEVSKMIAYWVNVNNELVVTKRNLLKIKKIDEVKPLWSHL